MLTPGSTQEKFDRTSYGRFFVFWEAFQPGEAGRAGEPMVVGSSPGVSTFFDQTIQKHIFAKRYGREQLADIPLPEITTFVTCISETPDRQQEKKFHT